MIQRAIWLITGKPKSGKTSMLNLITDSNMPYINDDLYIVDSFTPPTARHILATIRHTFITEKCLNTTASFIFVSNIPFTGNFDILRNLGYTIINVTMEERNGNGNMSILEDSEGIQKRIIQMAGLLGYNINMNTLTEGKLKEILNVVIEKLEGPTE